MAEEQDGLLCVPRFVSPATSCAPSHGPMEKSRLHRQFSVAVCSAPACLYRFVEKVRYISLLRLTAVACRTKLQKASRACVHAQGPSEEDCCLFRDFRATAE